MSFINFKNPFYEKVFMEAALRHEILYNSSARVIQQSTGFRKISTIVSLLNMIFHVINLLNYYFHISFHHLRQILCELCSLSIAQARTIPCVAILPSTSSSLKGVPAKCFCPILFYTVTYTYMDSLNPKGQVSSFKTLGPIPEAL